MSDEIEYIGDNAEIPFEHYDLRGDAEALESFCDWLRTQLGLVFVDYVILAHPTDAEDARAKFGRVGQSNRVRAGELIVIPTRATGRPDRPYRVTGWREVR